MSNNPALNRFNDQLIVRQEGEEDEEETKEDFDGPNVARMETHILKESKKSSKK